MLNLRNKKILIIAPHPDDEILGAGGLINRAKREGGKVFILYLTVGDTHDFSKNGFSSKDKRIREIKKVSEFLKFDGYKIAFPGDNFHLRLDNMPQKVLINEIERGKDISLEVLKPDFVIAPSNDDYNQDHRAASNALITATRPSPITFKSLQKAVLFYEGPQNSWSNNHGLLMPDLFVELTKNDLEAKIKALSFYKSQIKHPFSTVSPKIVKMFACLRGAQSGVCQAEAFFTRRILV